MARITNTVTRSPRTRPLARAALCAGAFAAALSGCGSSGSEGRTPASSPATGQMTIDPGDGGRYRPVIDPADYVAAIDNPYLPLEPGARWVWHERGPDGEVEVITMEVTDERRTVMGVSTIVVHDVAQVDGEVVEDTYDWYAQDLEGNVWYFGEDTTAHRGGSTSKEGSWEAGVDGALPGIAMPADPTPSATGYRQEYLQGEAEDMGQVIDSGGHLAVADRSFEDVIVTRDWTPLDPEVVEEKSYAPGVGLVREEKSDGSTLELVEHTPPS